jgi:glycine cleavage system aminomethyltransferase T
MHPAGMLALDVARIEAGLILIEVDYFSSKRALIESQKYSPYEIGLGKLGRFEEGTLSSDVRHWKKKTGADPSAC